MRMAKVSLNKRNSTVNRVEDHHVMEEDDHDFDHDDGDPDVDTSFSIEDDHGELNLEKVESLLGIPLSGKAILSSSCGSGGSSSELIIKPSRKLVAGKRKSEKTFESHVPSSSSGRGRAKVPKVTLKLGMSSSGTIITTSSSTSSNLNGLSSISQLPSGRTSPNKNAMKVRSSARLSMGVSGSSNGGTISPGSPANQQSGGPLTPRTPGTPSDHGANTPNPPTPGNTNSSSMVNSPHQYVTITVDGEGGVPNEGGVSVGGTSSYVTYVEGSTDHSSLYAVAAAAASNGQTMTYPVYTAADTSAMYNAGAPQYYSGNTGTQGVNYSQDEIDESNGIGNDSVDALAATDFNILSSGSGGSSMISSSPEIDTLHQHQHALLDGGVYMVPASSTNNNNNSGTSEGEGPANLSHATRVSPATTKRKRSEPPPLKPMLESSVKGEDFDSDEDCDDEDGFNDGNESGDPAGSLEDGFMSSFLSKSEMKALASIYPMGKTSEQLGTTYHAKTCPDTVQWLLDNYETAEGVSLPRSTLYYHYLRHCSENKLDPVNAASFGKLIRSVFLGLRTRRLGTRGNSKYHYYGIRLKPNSTLNHLPEDFPFQSGHGSMTRSNAAPAHSPGTSAATGVVSNKRLKTVKSEGYDVSHSNGFALGESVGVQQYLGDPNGALDDFPELDMEIELPEGLLEDDLLIFRSLYREHCESLLEALGNFQLGQIEALWRFFWRTSNNQGVESNSDYEKILPKTKLILLCQVKVVQDFVKEADYSFYQKMVGILLPDVLRPIPSTMTQAIRNCAKTLENWLSTAMLGYPEEMIATKVTVVSALAQTLRRYTSLNHLAQAARAVLQNQNQITQMLSDLNRVDFHNVEEQASWVCGCDGDLVPNLEQDFKATLAQQQSLEQWASWLEGVVERVLRPHVNTPRFVQAARHFLLKWSFYSSLIIRDLTLRSAASFGSFHLLRLLYDEYMFYLVEHRVAQVSGIVPIAVIGKKSMEPSFNSLALSSNNLSTISGSTISQVNVNGQSNVVSICSTTAGSLAPSSPLSDGQGSIAHTNNNTTSASYGSTTVKSEFKRVKNFLIS